MRFPVIKIQSASGELLTKLLPHAEKLNVKLGYEIHAPEGPNTDKIMKIRDTYAKFDSPLLGFVPDFSSTMFKMGRTMLQAFRDKGLDEPAIEKVQEVWLKDTPVFERITEFVGYLEGRGLDPNMLGPFGRMAFNMNGHIAVEEWKDIMPQIVHVHGKFFDMNPDGQVDAIDYPAHVRLLAEGGYDGYISSEWEGHAFADIGVMDPFVVVKQQQDLMKQYM
jgi:sugar phosphate isomerase/epimerase